MKPDILNINQSLPRYTSYPTAPHFIDAVNADTYENWLKQIKPESTLSLYVHIPFCDTLCWFCGCHTKITRKYEPVYNYMQHIHREAEYIASIIPAGCHVTDIHFGGGSPTILKPGSFRETVNILKSSYSFSPRINFAIEVDPRGLEEAQIATLAACGVNRVSIGIQDFDPDVQVAINRIQPFDETERVVRLLRAHGINSINMDLLYGLPLQNISTIEKTLEQVLSLQPDRISYFGYAHVPWMKKHQSLIDSNALPDAGQRIEQSRHSSFLLEKASYVRIGLDHFAKPGDSLVSALKSGNLRRNFQGYTTDNASSIIGLGASAIGKLSQGYIQNRTDIRGYQTSIRERGLATVRGLELTDEDRIRADIIEKLMCNLNFSGSALKKIYGDQATPYIREADFFTAYVEDGYIAKTEDGFLVTEKGRPFLRGFCACFDSYLNSGKAKHSLAV